MYFAKFTAKKPFRAFSFFIAIYSFNYEKWVLLRHRKGCPSFAGNAKKEAPEGFFLKGIII
jgi:hypothetical protein